MSKQVSQKDRLFRLLSKGKNVTAAQAEAKGVTGKITSLVSQLRKEGLVIWANRTTCPSTGKSVTAYRYDANRSYTAIVSA